LFSLWKEVFNLAAGRMSSAAPSRSLLSWYSRG